MTHEEKQIMQSIIDGMYGQFLTVVDEGRRDLTLEEIEVLADGRVFTARQALDHKLIDSIGYLDDVIRIAEKASGLTDAKVITYYRHTDYKNNIYSQSTINIFSLGENPLFGEYFPVRFMYLWNP